jgi:Tfp pilus assembly protein PilX
MIRSRLSARDEQGFAVVLVLCLAALLAILSVTLIGAVQSESTRSVHGVSRDASFQAAEAGIDDYISKLVDDHLYYSHYVHAGEATRRDAGGATVAASTPWSGSLSWTYPSGKNAWRQLGNGYEYDLQITAPSAGSTAVGIVSTGRPVNSTNLADWRTVQTLIRPSSVSDFQMLAAADINYGSTATTYGKIYAGIDSAGNKHSVTHSGIAYADIYAEKQVIGTPTMKNGAKKYDQTNIRTMLKNPVNFNDFLTSLVDIKRASQVGGVYFDQAGIDAWQLTFQANGTFLAQQCTKVGTQDIALTKPTCGTATTYTVPSNGAIYSAQSVIVSGQINGRVTVAANNNLVIGNNISYVTSGDDVLGLVAANDMIVAYWAPSNLSWRAATIAQSGAWRSWNNDGSHGAMTFQGSTTTNLGGYMGMFSSRVYQYDDTLLYLQPPWFPTVADAYTIVVTRELTVSR